MNFSALLLLSFLTSPEPPAPRPILTTDRVQELASAAAQEHAGPSHGCTQQSEPAFRVETEYRELSYTCGQGKDFRVLTVRVTDSSSKAKVEIASDIVCP